MKKQWQRANDECLRACVATLLDLDYLEVPHFVANVLTWLVDLENWLASKNMQLSFFKYPSACLPAFQYAIALIPSETFEGYGHAIIVDSKWRMSHDPRLAVPSNARYDDIKWVLIISEV